MLSVPIVILNHHRVPPPLAGALSKPNRRTLLLRPGPIPKHLGRMPETYDLGGQRTRQKLQVSMVSGNPHKAFCETLHWFFVRSPSLGSASSGPSSTSWRRSTHKQRSTQISRRLSSTFYNAKCRPLRRNSEPVGPEGL